MPRALVAALALTSPVVLGSEPSEVTFLSEILPLSQQLREEMTGVSWRPGCPVPLEELRLLRLRHYDLQGAIQQGELVAHRDVAAELVEIFGALFDARFPIARMQRVEAYGGDDERSMADNNTSAFNCRRTERRPEVFSRHSHGRAVDVNPLQNPFVRDGRVSPEGGRAYLERRATPGLIRAGDACHRAFTRRGWGWGGAWRTLKDYQHFEKR